MKLEIIQLLTLVDVDGARFAKRPAKDGDKVPADTTVTESTTLADTSKVTELPKSAKDAPKKEGEATKVKFECPEESGLFPDSKQCDKYYECKNGTATEQLCVDGLVFNQDSKRFGKCDQPFNVDCDGRPKLRKI